MILLGQADKGPVLTGHCGVGDQENKAEAEPAAEWAGEENEVAWSEWLKGSMDVLAGLWVLGARVLDSYTWETGLK